MKYYIIAGENSGDFIGSKLMYELKIIANDRHEKVFFEGIGGEKMSSEGLSSLFPIEQINIMGFLEVLIHLPKIRKLIIVTAKDIISKNPDMLITIDSPGFTYRVAQKVRLIAPHIKLVHVVAPSVWAYKAGRVKKYAKLYNYLLTLFPFEPQSFIQKGLASTCIGHPALEQDFYIRSVDLRNEMNIPHDTRVIAITPGSRKGEIVRHMPIIKVALNQLSSTIKIYVFFIQPNENNISLISYYLEDALFNYAFTTNRLKAYAVSDCALAKSGTNTLEIAASGTPMVIGYKLNTLTFSFLKLLLKIKYACLINIIANREIIPEYIQSDFNKENIVFALNELLSDEKKSLVQVKDAQKILSTIGFRKKKQKPSTKAAKIISNIAI